MSTSSVPSKSPEGAFSYAAAASGKSSPKATATAASTQMNIPGAGTLNGTLSDITKTEAAEPSLSLDTANTPKKKASSSSLSSGTAAAVNGESLSFSSSPDRKLSNDERGSTSEKSYQPEGDQVDSNKQPTKVAEATRERLVPAPPPPVNIWILRAEEFREAKAKMQPVATVPLHAAASKSTSPKSAEKPSEARNPERRRTGKQADAGGWDAEKGRESNSYDRKDVQKDSRDRKKSTDAGRANGYLPREDGNVRHGRPSRHATKSNSEKEATSSDLPPSLGDATSWPTPETAQDEEKRERERLQAEKEKDKPAVARSSGHTKFVPVPAPFLPKIVHNAPLPTKMGRGSRGGRGISGRGTSSVSTGEGRAERPERPEKAPGAGSVTQNSDDRERGGHRGFGYGPRGSYHNTSRGGRRTGSVGSSSQRKEESPVNPPQEKRDFQHSGNSKGAGACPEGGMGPVSGTASQSGEARKEEVAGKQSEHDDGAFVGQGVIPPQYVERSHSHSLNTANGQAYQRPDPSIHPDGYSQGRSERGSANSRGTFRGRGNHYNSQHHHSSHSSTINNQTYSPHNHTQYPSHNPSFRGYIRGRSAARGYHQQPYPAVMYPSQPYPPYPYFDYGLNPGVNSHIANVPMSIVSVNTSNGNSNVMEEALAHRDYAQSKEFYSGIRREVATQMEYYFSVDNLCKDIYLRRHMDSEGWVSLNLIAGFTMIQKHTRNLEILRDACQSSPEIEVMLAPDGYRVRKAVNFKPFVLRPEERDPVVQRREFGQEFGLKKEATSDSSLSNDSGRSQMSAAAAPFQPSLSQRQSLNSVTTPTELFGSQPIVNGVPPQTPIKFEPNGIERTYSQLSANAAEFSMPDGFTSMTHVSGLEHRPDSHPMATDFPDDKIDDITIIYKKSLEEKAVEGLQALNGEISSIGNDDEDETEYSPPSPISGDRPFRNGVSWTIDSQSGDPNVKHSHESYTKLRGHALQKRLEGFPTSVKMTILYHFWSHFLMDHFNRKMYDEFKSFAMEDALVTSGKTLEILFGFYESTHIAGFPSEELSHDFVEMAYKGIGNGTNLGVHKLEAAIQNPHVNPSVRDLLQRLKLCQCEYSDCRRLQLLS